MAICPITPTTKSAPNKSEALLAITMKRQMSSTKSKITAMPPNSPSSSQIMEKSCRSALREGSPASACSAPALAENAAGANGIQRLQRLEAGTGSISFRVQPGQDAAPAEAQIAVFHLDNGEYQRRHRRHACGSHQHKPFIVRACHKSISSAIPKIIIAELMLLVIFQTIRQMGTGIISTSQKPFRSGSLFPSYR